MTTVTDVSDGHDSYWDDDYYGDERADDSPEPDFEPLEYQRYASMSPFGRLRYDLRKWIRGYAWRLRMKACGRRPRGHATTADQPPF